MVDSILLPTDHRLLHSIMEGVASLIGHQIADDAPSWVHVVLHIVLLWGPVAAILLIIYLGARAVARRAWSRSRWTRPEDNTDAEAATAPAVGLYGYIITHSKPQQVLLVLGGLASTPVLYATLELPKLIVNNAISSGHFPIIIGYLEFSQTDYLFALSGAFLAVLAFNGWIKFTLNTFKGRVGERLLRRLRLDTLRRWRRMPESPRRVEVIPLIGQEIEPIGGFAADAFALPVFQGASLATILVFMFMQDPVLGLAAIALTPIQILVTPPQQRQVTALARERAFEIRGLAREFTEPSAAGRAELCALSTRFKRIEVIRRRLHFAKYRMKAVNNFIVAMTPFLFYAIGGYLVIEERLSLGALIAVLAAYKDFSAPVRELFNYARTRADAQQRFDDLSIYLADQTATRPAPPTLRVAVAAE